MRTLKMKVLVIKYPEISVTNEKIRWESYVKVARNYED